MQPQVFDVVQQGVPRTHEAHVDALHPPVVPLDDPPPDDDPPLDELGAVSSGASSGAVSSGASSGPESSDGGGPVSSSPSPGPAVAQATIAPRTNVTKPPAAARPYQCILPVYMSNPLRQRSVLRSQACGDAHGTRRTRT